MSGGRNLQTQQLSFVFSASVITPQGDGSYFVRPGKPVMELTPLQAGKILGCCRSLVYQYIQSGLLSARRPAPRKILIPAEAVESLRKKTEDPEFWESER